MESINIPVNPGTIGSLEIMLVALLALSLILLAFSVFRVRKAYKKGQALAGGKSFFAHAETFSQEDLIHQKRLEALGLAGTPTTKV